MSVPNSRLMLRDPGQLIAAIPTLLAFRPGDSVIVVTYTADTDHWLLGAVLRTDIPDPAAVDGWVEQLCAAVTHNDATAVVLVLLGGGPAAGTASTSAGGDGSDLPGRPLLDVLATSLERTGLMVGDRVWAASVDAGTWRCYRDPTRRGAIPDPVSLPVVTALTVAGAVTYASREDLAAVLAPDPAEALAHRAALIADLPAVDPRTESRFLTGFVEHLHTGHTTEPLRDDATLARLAHALDHGRVRDTAFGLCVGSRAQAAERVWTVLVCATPAALRAHPASLLGICAYLRGAGPLAAIAFEVACDADPDHPIASSLRQALNLGLHPTQIRGALHASLAAAGHAVPASVHSGSDGGGWARGADCP